MRFIKSFLTILLNAAAIILLMFYPLITRTLAALTVLAFFRYTFTGSGEGYAIAFFMAFIGTKLIILAPFFTEKRKSVR